MVNSNLNIQSLFPTNANAGGKVDTGGVSPVVGNNKGQAISGGKSSLSKVKQSTPQIQRAKAELQSLQFPVKQANTQNSASVTDFRLAQDDAIKGFQASLGNVEVPITAFKSDSSVPTFNLAAAQGALKTSAFDFTTDTLTPASLDAKDSTEIANSEGNNALSSLGEAMGSFDGGLGSIGSGGVQIATGIGMLSTSGFTFGLSSIPAIAMIAKGGMEVTQGFMETTQGQNESVEAQNTGEKATAKYTATAKDLKNNSANLDQLKTFYTGFTPVLNTLQTAQGKNDLLVGYASKIDPSIQAAATPANPADSTNLAGTSNGTPTVPAPANVADASWATPPTTEPATTPTGDTAQAGGSSAPTALGVQAPLAGGNTAQATPQAGGLTDAEKGFMTAFKANSGVVNSANGLLKGTLSSQAPTGFDTAGLASQTVADASQSQPLQELYYRLKEKEAQAQAKNQQTQGLGTAFTGNGVNPQGQVDPNAPQGQVATAQAPQAPPATPASTAAAPTRTLTIPNFAPQSAFA